MSKKKVIDRKDYVNQVSKSKTPSLKKVMCELAVVAMASSMDLYAIDCRSRSAQIVMRSFGLYVKDHFNDIVSSFKKNSTIDSEKYVKDYLYFIESSFKKRYTIDFENDVKKHLDYILSSFKMTLTFGLDVDDQLESEFALDYIIREALFGLRRMYSSYKKGLAKEKCTAIYLDMMLRLKKGGATGMG